MEEKSIMYYWHTFLIAASFLNIFLFIMVCKWVNQRLRNIKKDYS